MNKLDKLKKQINKKSTDKSNFFSVSEVIVIILISIIFGFVIGWGISTSKKVNKNDSKEIEEIITTYNAIIDNYYDDINKSELTDAAIKGMISVLDDPYSIYMNSSDTSYFLEDVNGYFVGIGVSVQLIDDKFKIVEIMKNSPAAKANIKLDDVIIGVDKKDVKGLSLDELSDRIKGEVGTNVSLVLLRDGKKINVKVSRNKIEIPTITSDIYNDEVGYIAIDKFSATTSEQFKNALNDLEKVKIKSLIIDVRDNPGGKLDQVNKILDLFFNKKVVLYQIEKKNDKIKVYADKSDKKDLPVVVLVNQNSASAAEILASSFQDNYKKCSIVGSVTYGKGTIQKASELSSGASIKYTTQKWLTSKGKWLNEIGVIPDEVVSQKDEYYKEPIFANDIQLQKAIEILKG